MGLNKDEGKQTFVNISEGKLYTKKKGEEKDFFGSLSGTIVKVKFEEDEYNGTKYEKASIYFVDGDENFCLQMRTDSGYFRGFCNSLKMGNPVEKITVSAAHKEENNGRPQTTCFVKQGGETLKHFYTKEKQGDLPQLDRVRFKGQDIWDGTKQIEFWKNWLSGIQFRHELVADVPEQIQRKPIPDAKNVTEPIDDLPF